MARTEPGQWTEYRLNREYLLRENRIFIEIGMPIKERVDLCPMFRKDDEIGRDHYRSVLVKAKNHNLQPPAHKPLTGTYSYSPLDRQPEIIMRCRVPRRAAHFYDCFALSNFLPPLIKHAAGLAPETPFLIAADRLEEERMPLFSNMMRFWHLASDPAEASQPVWTRLSYRVIKQLLSLQKI